MTSLVVGIGGIAALLLPLAQFLFFLGAFLLFFLPLFGGAGVGFGFALQFAELLLLVGKRLRGAVERVGQIVDGVAEGARVVAGEGIRRLLDLAQLLELPRTAFEQGAQPRAHIAAAAVLVFDPVLQFVVHRDVLAQQPVEILAGIVVRVGGLAAKIHKTVQPVLGESEVKFDATAGVPFTAGLVLAVLRTQRTSCLRHR